jgi:2'-5' RNA ligase
MRLFIAVDMDSAIREKLESLKRILNRKGVKPVEKDNIHITLKFLGEVEEGKIEPIKESLKKIEMKAFRMHVKGIGFFPSASNPRIVWVGVEEGEEEMVKLAEMIENAMKKFGFRRDKSFVAHATLARMKKITSEEKKRLVRELESVNQDFGWMEVKDFRLKQSTLTPSGPIYRDVAMFELR